MDIRFDILRENLPTIRRFCGITAEELGAFLGVSRQMISSIETKPGLMNKRHFLAITYVVENQLIPELEPDDQPCVRRMLTERVVALVPRMPVVKFEKD